MFKCEVTTIHFYIIGKKVFISTLYVEDIVLRDYDFLLNNDKLSCDGQGISNLKRKALSRVEWKQ